MNLELRNQIDDIIGCMQEHKAVLDLIVSTYDNYLAYSDSNKKQFESIYKDTIKDCIDVLMQADELLENVEREKENS